MATIQEKQQPQLTVEQVKAAKGSKLLSDVVAYIKSPDMKSMGYDVDANDYTVRITRHVYHNIVGLLHNGSATFYEAWIKERLAKKFPDYSAYFKGDKRLTD